MQGETEKQTRTLCGSRENGQRTPSAITLKGQAGWGGVSRSLSRKETTIINYGRHEGLPLKLKGSSLAEEKEKKAGWPRCDRAASETAAGAWGGRNCQGGEVKKSGPAAAGKSLVHKSSVTTSTRTGTVAQHQNNPNPG